MPCILFTGPAFPPSSHSPMDPTSQKHHLFCRTAHLIIRYIGLPVETAGLGGGLRLASECICAIRDLVGARLPPLALSSNVLHRVITPKETEMDLKKKRYIGLLNKSKNFTGYQSWVTLQSLPCSTRQASWLIICSH